MHSSEAKDVVKSEGHLLARMTDSFQQLLVKQQENTAALTLPQPQIPVYDGNPIDYLDFIRAFENLIESKTCSSSARLYYLIQYMSGSVQDLRKSCLLMACEKGYVEARRLLKEWFGQAYKIATAHLSRLLDCQPIRSEDNAALQGFSILLRCSRNTLKELDYQAKLENPDTLKKIIDKLPYALRLRWRDYVDRIQEDHGREITIDDVTHFVTLKARAASHPVFGNVTNDKAMHERRQPFTKARNFAVVGDVDTKNQASKPIAKSKPTPQCPMCKAEHWLAQCTSFRKVLLSEREEFVIEQRLCRNCLVCGHFSRACEKRSFCKVENCAGKHSTFLHPKNEESKPLQRNAETTRSSQHTSSASNGFVDTEKRMNKAVTGLPIVPVKVKAPGQDKVVQTYAFLDNGSNTCFCTEVMLNELNLKGEDITLSLTTLENADSSIRCSVAKIEIYDLDENNLVEVPKVFAVQRLPVSKDNIARQQDVDRWNHLRGIHIHDIRSEVSLLIGNDAPEALQPLEVRKSENGGPYATRTVFGWAINGPLGKNGDQGSTANFINADLSEQFERFCNLEFNDARYESRLAMSPNDKRALDAMKASVLLREDNHYEIALPWKEHPPPLLNNRSLAEHRLKHLKRRLEREPVTCEKYVAFVNGLLSNGYARRMPLNELITEDPTWYLPHHPVFHPKKPEKIRVVYYCSAKWRRTSLNDCLLQGPDLTSSLVGVLTRFRQEPVALMSDIEAMFYQVYVRPSDCSCLRFLWWPDGNLDAEPSEYQMLVHLFGGASSPSCANFTLKQTAEDNKEEFNVETVQTVKDNFYVDDCLKSVATVPEAIELTSQLRELLALGGFRLTKWVSNSKEVLDYVPESERATSTKSIDFDGGVTERALGVHWNVVSDEFGFKISRKENPQSRRGILSTVSSVYDPLGFASPFILTSKIILQQLCKKGLGWDDPIPEIELEEWKSWQQDLPKLELFNTNRCFKPTFFTPTHYELHHFSDASERGYGAVSYLRMKNDQGDAHCAFVMSKARVAPLKVITIPRMELAAAVLATRLDALITREMTLPISSSTFWTDSTCVLRYIANEDKRYQTFVSNKFSTIRERSSPDQWRYVKTSSNPADDASRGLSADSLLNSERWLSGPEFLSHHKSTWPAQPADLSISNQDPEVKKDAKVLATLASENPRELCEMFERFSSWTKLRRVVAWILRYMSILKKRCLIRKSGRAVGYGDTYTSISVEEIRAAEGKIIKQVQSKHFKAELTKLKNANTFTENDGNPNTLKKTSDIHKLDPVLIDGVLRVGGRLHQAPICRRITFQK